MVMTMNTTPNLILSEIWKRHRPDNLAGGVPASVPTIGAVPGPVPTRPYNNPLNILDVPTSPLSPSKKHTMGEGVCEGGEFAGPVNGKSAPPSSRPRAALAAWRLNGGQLRSWATALTDLPVLTGP